MSEDQGVAPQDVTSEEEVTEGEDEE